MIALTEQWVGRREAAQILGVDVRYIDRLKTTGRLTVRSLPGASVRFPLAEVEALAEASTKPRSQPTEQPK